MKTCVFQAIGICLEGRRLDQLRDIIIGSGKPLPALRYARTASSTVVHRAVRERVVRLIVDVFQVHTPMLVPCVNSSSIAPEEHSKDAMQNVQLLLDVPSQPFHASHGARVCLSLSKRISTVAVQGLR